MVTYDDKKANILESLNGYLLRGLEAEFYYTGGVRLINPRGDYPQKLKAHLGPEISVEHFTEPRRDQRPCVETPQHPSVSQSTRCGHHRFGNE